MARGAAPNQSSTSKPTGSRGGPPAGANAVMAQRKRRGAPQPKGGAQQGRPQGNFGNNGMLKFYTEEAPGLKIGPTTVLVLSLVFIVFVVLLHIWGKFRA